MEFNDQQGLRPCCSLMNFGRAKRVNELNRPIKYSTYYKVSLFLHIFNLKCQIDN